MAFHYELSTFSSFHAMDAYRAGLIAGSACIVGPAISCSEETERTFLHYTGADCAPIMRQDKSLSDNQ